MQRLLPLVSARFLATQLHEIGYKSAVAHGGVISVFVQIVAFALWRRDQHANAPSPLQNRDDSHENRDHP